MQEEIIVIGPIVIGEPAPALVAPPEKAPEKPVAEPTPQNLTILSYPDPRLRRVSYPITEVTQDVLKLATALALGVIRLGGWGLAAPQVGYQVRLIVLNMTREPKDTLIFINPEIMTKSEETCVMPEACLSVPGVVASIKRPSKITLRAMTAMGVVEEKEYDGLIARVIQHEICHLDGGIFFDLVTDPVKKRLIETKLKKLAQNAKKKARERVAS